MAKTTIKTTTTKKDEKTSKAKATAKKQEKVEEQDLSEMSDEDLEEVLNASGAFDILEDMTQNWANVDASSGFLVPPAGQHIAIMQAPTGERGEYFRLPFKFSKTDEENGKEIEYTASKVYFLKNNQTGEDTTEDALARLKGDLALMGYDLDPDMSDEDAFAYCKECIKDAIKNKVQIIINIKNKNKVNPKTKATETKSTVYIRGRAVDEESE